ncbi:MAG TPA: hypothetical protein VD813_15635 [Pseudonocardia sp.]|nr:hypothetical protein [Pseudonocardia sp.]
MGGRWSAAGEDSVRAQVRGRCEPLGDAEGGSGPVAGRIRVWLRRTLWAVVGVRRIALTAELDGHRLVLDTEVGRPPYVAGIRVPARLAGSGAEVGAEVWIDPFHLLGIGVALTLNPPPEDAL